MDSEPAEIEGEAAENGDTGDTGAELDDGTGNPRAYRLPHGDHPIPHWGQGQSDLNSGKTSTIHIKAKARSSEEVAVGSWFVPLFCH